MKSKKSIRRVRLPEIGEVYSLNQMVAICTEFHRMETVERLMDLSNRKEFVFDGCSGPAPETLPISKVDLKIPCLLHDIAYYAADPDDPNRRVLKQIEDYRLAIDMLEEGASVEATKLYLTGVELGGDWWPGSQWGYGRRST